MEKSWVPLMQISIHAPARGATLVSWSMTGILFPFQSTLPRGERLCHQKPRMFYRDFNPRSREGSDSSCFSGCSCFSISIHAPARGATVFSPENRKPEAYFNPRSREGSDIVLLRSSCTVVCISIHAPARGATCTRCINIAYYHISIHAPARGATRLVVYDLDLHFYFNPRSREGSDSTPA